MHDPMVKIDVTVHIHGADGDEHRLRQISQLLHELLDRSNSIMRTQAEHAADLEAVTKQVAKIGEETGKTLQRVTELEALLAQAGNTSPEVDAKMDELKRQAQVTDDMVPDPTT